MNIGDMRENYAAGKLHRSDLCENPYDQFQAWFAEALKEPAIREANAMTLATCGANGRVTARTVLLKGWDYTGFVFFTNYESEKARQLAENPQASLLFPWVPMERQIAICGRAEKVSREESEAYFAARPLASRLGAWASHQSTVVTSREVIEVQYAEAEHRFLDGNVPLPDYWGGYRVVPETIEFWQGRRSRLHDRFLYSRDGESWKIDRLSP